MREERLLYKVVCCFCWTEKKKLMKYTWHEDVYESKQRTYESKVVYLIWNANSLIWIELVSFALQFWAFRGTPATPRRSQSRCIILVGTMHTGCLDRRSACLGAQQLGQTTQRTEAGQRVEGPRLGQQLG